MDITKLTETELKALIYDEIVKKEIASNNINALQVELNKRNEYEDKKPQE
jgi:hypothetical protein